MKESAVRDKKTAMQQWQGPTEGTASLVAEKWAEGKPNYLNKLRKKITKMLSPPHHGN